ncbi:hypothetical protein A7A08_03030 [Methyloligella halotolerans]|uniref:Uroporphyrin-III C-methyltransferase n=1 Tax=Methyloligella halotolerans TaxID=1177755 RepID=A0A1E2RUT4_9HYPH|nr:hypothetical protein A7A08_03030 [Methyloligella halotolerans]
MDRLWPRGISKKDVDLDAHWTDCAPSDGLRKWFSHDPVKWADFRKKYLHELSQNRERVRVLLEGVGKDKLVLLYGAKDEAHTHARVLKEYLEKLK